MCCSDRFLSLFTFCVHTSQPPHFNVCPFCGRSNCLFSGQRMSEQERKRGAESQIESQRPAPEVVASPLFASQSQPSYPKRWCIQFHALHRKNVAILVCFHFLVFLVKNSAVGVTCVLFDLDVEYSEGNGKAPCSSCCCLRSLSWRV